MKQAEVGADVNLHRPQALVGGARLAAFSLLGLFVAGCAGTLSDGRRWGADATITPGWDRVWRSAARAALDARTLAPAVAAGVLAFGDLDERLSDVASRKTPIFGSQATAQTYSDVMVNVLTFEALATAFATPSGALDTTWLSAKLKGALLVEGGAIATTEGVVQLLKSVSNRPRPDGSDDYSFPSGHAARSFAAAALASSNLDVLRLDPWVRTAAEIAHTTAAVSVAWARVEGNKHFPTDVFAGAAIGNFIGMFIHGAFLGLRDEETSYWRILPLSGGAMLVVGWRY